MTAMRILVIAPAPPLDVHAALRPMGAEVADAWSLEVAIASHRASPCQVVVLDRRIGRSEPEPAAAAAALQIPCVLLSDAALNGSVSVAKLAEAVGRAAAPSQESAIDWADLRDRLEGDEGLGLEVLAAFAGDAPDLVRRLKELVLSGADCPSITRLAHQIKGAAANASVKGMRAAAHQIELAGKSCARDSFPAPLAALEAGLAALQKELSARRRP